MQLALISDIHGNLVALDAILQNIQQRQIEQIICLGDVAASGPQPHEAIQRLRAVNCPIIMGNTDAWLLNPLMREQKTSFGQRSQDINLWCIQQLTEEDKAFLATFAATITCPLNPQHTLLAYHGSPRSFNEQLLPTTSDETLEEALNGTSAQVYAGGHTHQQMFRRYKDKLIINAGSVGLAMDRSTPLDEVRNPPWSEYAILTVTDKALSVELCRVPFDITSFIEITLHSDMPHAQRSASEWLQA